MCVCCIQARAGVDAGHRRSQEVESASGEEDAESDGAEEEDADSAYAALQGSSAPALLAQDARSSSSCVDGAVQGTVPQPASESWRQGYARGCEKAWAVKTEFMNAGLDEGAGKPGLEEAVSVGAAPFALSPHM